MTTGRVGRRGLAAAGLAALAAAGCGGVDRRFVVESNVPNAQVTIDQRRVGPAPAYAPFEYYGKYRITVSHPDYQTNTQCVDVPAPWYAYPPFDLFAEVFWPVRIDDVRRLYVPLEPARRPDVGELVTAADALRERGHALPPPPDPAPPKMPAEPPPPAAAPPPGLPPWATPGPVPVAPPTRPPAAPPPTSPLIPSVQP
jgi:hypothetical protein